MSSPPRCEIRYDAMRCDAAYCIADANEVITRKRWSQRWRNDSPPPSDPHSNVLISFYNFIFRTLNGSSSRGSAHLLYCPSTLTKSDPSSSAENENAPVLPPDEVKEKKVMYKKEK